MQNTFTFPSVQAQTDAAAEALSRGDFVAASRRFFMAGHNAKLAHDCMTVDCNAVEVGQ